VKPPPIAAALFCLCLVALAAGTAAAQQHPSVLVQLTALRRGSLPRIVTAYGKVEPGPAARRTVTAPVTAVVGAVYARPGQEVAADAPLVLLGPSPATAAAYARARSALQAADGLVARTRTLLGQHLATRQQLADAEKSQADARATLIALEAEGAGAPQTLRAPFRAIVSAVSTSPGAIVAPGMALIDLTRPNALVLRVGVMPDRADAIRPSEPVRITPLGARDGVAGTVVLRGSVVDPATGLVPVDIALPPGKVLAGEMAAAEIVIGRARGYVVPHAAILVDRRGAPYVVQAVNRIARKVPVRVLDGAGGRNVVTGPLDPAAPLVLAGNYQLKNGMRVRLPAPAGTKPR
jgi:membrane fusion protein (multidrug efflux system)